MPEASAGAIDLRLSERKTASGHRIGHATLDSPSTLNALSLSMIDGLAAAFDRWFADPSVVAIVLDGAGEKAFCAGGDVQAIYRAIRETAAGDVPRLASDFFEREYRLDYRIHRAPKPILCWGHGIVMGGGIGLHVGASHRVVTPRTRMAMPEITIGLYPDVGGSWFLPRAPGAVGLFLGLTGASINASDAVFAGLADFLVDHETKSDVFAALDAAEWSGDAAHDGALLSGLLAQREADVTRPAPQIEPHVAAIDAAIGRGEPIERIAVRLRALANHADPWLANAGATFAKGSPTSARLIHAIVERAKGLSLADVFRLEYQASIGCCVAHDFAEGVRALLIDKDRNPHWDPASLDGVTAALIARHFEPRFTGPHPLADLH